MSQRITSPETSSPTMDLHDATASLSTVRSKIRGAHCTNLVRSIDKLLKLSAVAKAEILTDVGRHLAGGLTRLNQSLLEPIAANNAEILLAPTVQQRFDILANQISGAVDRTGCINSKEPPNQSTLDKNLDTVAQFLTRALDEVGSYDLLISSVVEDGDHRVVLLKDKSMSSIPLGTFGPESYHTLHNYPDDCEVQDILSSCPRFRILVIGRSGTGKSSLINRTFSVDLTNESEYLSGVSDINFEITSPKNDLFILHDSQGFEQGELANLHTVKEFIEKRNAMPTLQDRVHAIWLCIQIPFAGGRLFEIGDEEFLKVDFGLPVIVVFTKYDNLRLKAKRELKKNPELKRRHGDQAASHIETAANKDYQKLCAEPLRRLASGRTIPATNVSIFDNKSLDNLIKLTSEHAQERLGGSPDYIEMPANLSDEPARERPDAVWLVWTIAQRASADLNVEASIAVGQTRYWRALACSFQFSGKSLQTCLNLIHNDVVGAWNFREGSMLYEEDFKMEVRCIVHDLVRDFKTEPTKAVSSASGLVGGLSSLAAPVFAPIASSDVLNYYLVTVYNQTPPVLRVIMGYIINLTAILEGLFNQLQSDPRSPSGTQSRSLSQTMIRQTIENYKNFKLSENGWFCHADIRNFVDHAPNIFEPDYRQILSRELIRMMKKYRFYIVQEWMDRGGEIRVDKQSLAVQKHRVTDNHTI